MQGSFIFSCIYLKIIYTFLLLIKVNLPTIKPKYFYDKRELWIELNISEYSFPPQIRLIVISVCIKSMCDANPALSIPIGWHIDDRPCIINNIYRKRHAEAATAEIQIRLMNMKWNSMWLWSSDVWRLSALTHFADNDDRNEQDNAYLPEY